MQKIDITLFLHGLALKDELKAFFMPNYKSLAYSKNIKKIQDINPFALFEIALSWADYSTIDSAFSNNSNALRVIHAPFVKGDKPEDISGQDRFVDLYSDTNRFEKDLYSMLFKIRKITNIKKPLTLIFHPLPYKSLVNNENILVDRLVVNLRRVCKMLQDFNVYLAIENMPFFTRRHKIYNETFGNYVFFKKIFEDCKCPNVGLTFDFGHANSSARYLWERHKLSSEELENFSFQRKFLSEVGNRLFHIHFHYNPAHISVYKLGVNKFIHKLQNYDFHDSIKNYRDIDVLNIRSIMADLLSKNRFNRTAPLTLTLEVLPRSLNSFSRYLSDVESLNKFLNNSVLK